MRIFLSGARCAAVLRNCARLIWILVLMAVLRMGGVAYGQQVGHYIGGITGLENGTAPPPGVFVSYIPLVQHVDELKDLDGHVIAHPNINVAANIAGYEVMLDKKILGANYGFSALFVIVNTRFNSAQFEVTEGYGGVSDLYFAPVVLGWEKGKANYLVNYGFYAPSGDFDPTKVMNPGLGFWEHQIQAGATYALDAKKLWNTSVLTTWEINMSKLGLDVRPGPMFTGEYSFGRRFGGYKWNAGVTGYGYQKLSPDSGSGVPALETKILDRSFGIGPEIKYTNPKWKMAFNFRFQEQFGVQAKTSGQIYAGGITFLNIFPPKGK